MSDDPPANAPDMRLRTQAVEQCLNQLTSILLARATRIASGLAPNLEMPGLMIMMFIDSRGQTSPAAIVKETGIDKSLVIHILETLRLHGHGTPIPNEYNRGHSLYSATRRGKQHLEQIRDENIEEYPTVRGAWTEPEILRFTEALRTFPDRIAGLPAAPCLASPRWSALSRI